MFIKSKRDEPVHDDQPFDYQALLVEVEHVPQEFNAFLHMHQEIRNACVHVQLQADLAVHLWARRGAANNALFNLNYCINNLIFICVIV
jgi:hypothetical protein